MYWKLYQFTYPAWIKEQCIKLIQDVIQLVDQCGNERENVPALEWEAVLEVGPVWYFIGLSCSHHHSGRCTVMYILYGPSWGWWYLTPSLSFEPSWPIHSTERREVWYFSLLGLCSSVLVKSRMKLALESSLNYFHIFGILKYLPDLIKQSPK